MATKKEQELFDVEEREQRDRGAGVDRRRFLAGLGAGALALSAARWVRRKDRWDRPAR